MPELPEVETVVRDLRPLLVGRTLTAIQVGERKLRRPWLADWGPILIGTTVAGLRRRAKWILVDLATGPRLLVHLGMTGQFTVAAADETILDHTHLIFDLDDTRQLRFRDVRRFGSVELFSDEPTVLAFLAERVGPEPEDMDPMTFRTTVRSSIRPLKAILLDQAIAAGVGNIYADEALHRARLHPQRRGNSVSDAEADRMRESIAAVIHHAIENRGSTIRDYIGGSGLRGNFQNEFRVYGRTGEPCLTCATPIEMVRVAGRASHYCKKCQKLGE